MQGRLIDILRRALRGATRTHPEVPANVIGAAAVYFYFNFVDPLDPLHQSVQPVQLQRFKTFLVVTTTLVLANFTVATLWLWPVGEWERRLRAGEDPALIPDGVRRRAVNAPLMSAVVTMIGWILAGLFYLFFLTLIVGVDVAESTRAFAGLVLVAGPLTSSLVFLASEFHWRRQIPIFFPDGRIDRSGVLRVPVWIRLGATFLVTSVLPLVVMLMVDFSFERRFGHLLPETIQPLWSGLLRTQAFIVVATGLASLVMATLVARFINHPVQALRTAMARVSAGDLSAKVPVRSTDELGELNEHFNAMVVDLRRAEHTRELFGRYVSPAVVRAALERGVALGGEVVRATAMFVDLRGFTALTQRSAPAHVVELLNEYYAIVERVCDAEGGVITQFLGDGLVIVFGGPLAPLPDHARRAVAAAIALQRLFAERNTLAGDGPRIDAGIGICTGDMIAGNVGAGDRVTYTIVGDAVNQAARLQVKTRDLGTPILLTESTRLALGDPNGVPLRHRGAVPLKGISAPVEVYSVEL